MSGTMLLEALSAVALLGVGGLTGWLARGRREDHRQQAVAQRRELERQRITHDTKRVSVARPGTRPGRVSRATIDMAASHMQQHNREVE
jgi:hypothetical protein